MLLSYIDTPEYMNSIKCDKIVVSVKSMGDAVELYPSKAIQIEDSTIKFNFHRYIQMLAAGEPLAFDMLEVPMIAYKHISVEWEQLVKNSHLLVNQEYIDTLTTTNAVVEGVSRVEQMGKIIEIPYDAPNTIRQLNSFKDWDKANA